MRDVLSLFRLRRTSQVEQARPEQVRNSAGGFTFELDDRGAATSLPDAGHRRRHVLHVGRGPLPRQCRRLVFRMAEQDHEGARARDRGGLGPRVAAPKQHAALFALA